jgi:SAM-dependent methyltransferase
VPEPWYRAAFGAFYPVLYAHRDAAEARKCLELLPRLAPLAAGKATMILDLGCGDGRHLEPAAAGAAPVVGLDLSADLLRAARARTADLPLVRADMRGLPFAPGRFGAVLSLFTAFGYFGPAGDGRVVAEVARVLAPGGHWFLDYLDAHRVRAELAAGPLQRTRRAGPLAVRETRRLEGGTVAKAVRLEAVPGHEAEAAMLGVGAAGVEYTERVALYALAELDGLAAAGGLQRVAAAGDYAGAPLGTGPRWLLAYRKGDRR